MPSVPTDGPTAPKPLRLWPGVVLAILLLVSRFGLPAAGSEWTQYGVMGSFFASVAIFLWWALLSRGTGTWSGGGLSSWYRPPTSPPARSFTRSIADGAMGMLFPILVLPVLSLALVAWAVLGRNLSKGLRRARPLRRGLRGFRGVDPDPYRRLRQRIQLGPRLALVRHCGRSGS